MRLYSNHVWSADVIDAVISTFQRPKYGFRIQLDEFAPAHFQRENESFRFKFKTVLGLYKISFDVLPDKIFVNIILGEVKYSISPFPHVYNAKCFNLGKMSKVRRWSVCAANTIFTEVQKIISENNTADVLHR